MHLKRVAESSREKPCQIMNRCLEDVPTTSACMVPNKNVIRQIIKRARAKSTPLEPKSLAEIDLPEDLKMFKGETFLIPNTNLNEDIKSLIFCTDKNIKLLQESTIWIMDGTFQSCPKLFMQLYSIHGTVGNGNNKRIVPLVYALLPRKTQECYTHFLTELKRYGQSLCNEESFAPQVVMTDFEIAVINSVRSVFPGTYHKTCLFHLGQNIWRRVQEFGLQNRYHTDGEFSLKIRHLIALAYLPPAEIPDVFNILKEKILPSDAAAITEWFEINYVRGIMTSRGHSSENRVIIRTTPPLFPPDLWSVHFNYENDLPSSQNSVEGWHRRWNALLDRKKLGIYATIREIQKEQAANNLLVEKIEAGIPKTPPKKKKRQQQEAISRFVDQRNNMEVLKFLKGIASNIFYL